MVGMSCIALSCILRPEMTRNARLGKCTQLVVQRDRAISSLSNKAERYLKILLYVDNIIHYSS